ncbi:MAG: phosphotransferase [Phycisphaerales bacterium]
MPTSDSGERVDAPAAPAGLGHLLAPAVQQACGGRLETVSWFRADWQRGGALTGRSRFHLEEKAEPIDVIVKVPVGPGEYLWNHRLQPNESDPNGITAMLFASGLELSGYDLAWIVIERFPEGPLFGLKRDDAIELMADAAARFYRRASDYPVDRRPRREDWDALTDRARENTATNRLPDRQRWRKAVKATQKQLKSLLSEWSDRAEVMWIHGDLHPANCMSRSNRPEDPAMLIDLAEVRAGHWIEDAIYLERMYWPRRDYLKNHPVVRLIADRRKALGLEVEDGVSRLADIRRTLLAATAPAFMKSEGHPSYLAACLETLEQSLSRLK